MKRRLFLAHGTACAFPAFANSPSAAVEGLLALPANRIDIGMAALTFAREIYPETDPQGRSREIDRLAWRAGEFIRLVKAADPESIIRALNTFLHKIHGVSYDQSPGGKENQANYFITGILDTRKGMCLTIPMLYMAIAQRLGYPVYGVEAPQHFFVRYVDPRLIEQNIELTLTAGYVPDDDYAFKLNISDKARRLGTYLRTLTNREFLGLLLQQNAIVFRKRGDEDRAIKYWEIAQRIDPRSASYPRNLAAAWYTKAKAARTVEEHDRLLRISRLYRTKAMDMGYTVDPDANTRGRKFP